MVNKWIGIGNLTKDVELRFTQAGLPVASFSIACNERWTDGNGQKQEHVEYVSIIAWRRLAEICSEFLEKGSKVYIEGKLQTRKWQDQAGADRYTTEIVARDMQMLTPRGTNAGVGSSPTPQTIPGRDDGTPPPHTGDDVPF